MGLSEDQARSFLSELSQRSGATVEQDDIRTLMSKNNPGDLEDRGDIDAHKQALEKQYALRGNTQRTGDGNRGSSNNNPLPAPQSSSGNNNVLQSWAQAPSVNPQLQELNDRLKRMDEESAAKKAAEQERRTALMDQLRQRATQTLDVGADVPHIKNQVNAYRTEQERAQREYLADQAESLGPNANLRNEERIAAERRGQNVSGFQAQLQAREIAAAREEIANALAMESGNLSAMEQATMQQQLAALDAAMGQVSLGLQGRSLDINERQGQSSLDLQRMAQEISRRQFEQDFGLRAEDRASYWDAVRSGLL